jgi:2'-5' RNA ligase
MRLFIAIPFDPPVLDALTAAQSSLKAGGVRGGYTVRQNLHMTLAFLGEVRDPRPVIAALGRVPLPQSTMTFEKTELFRDILVCSFRVDAPLRRYAQDLRRELENSAVGFDRKPFRPHVTLVRRASFAAEKPDIAADAALREIEIPVRRVCLMRTDFVDGRPKYSCMHTCAAAEQAAD